MKPDSHNVSSKMVKYCMKKPNFGPCHVRQIFFKNQGRFSANLKKNPLSSKKIPSLRAKFLSLLDNVFKSSYIFFTNFNEYQSNYSISSQEQCLPCFFMRQSCQKSLDCKDFRQKLQTFGFFIHFNALKIVCCMRSFFLPFWKKKTEETKNFPSGQIFIVA